MVQQQKLETALLGCTGVDSAVRKSLLDGSVLRHCELSFSCGFALWIRFYVIPAPPLSFQRRLESRRFTVPRAVFYWIPACAGMTSCKPHIFIVNLIHATKPRGNDIEGAEMTLNPNYATRSKQVREGNVILKFIFYILLFFILTCTIAEGAFLSNGFLVTSHVLEFDKNTKSSNCHGVLLYPEIKNENAETSSRINKAIENFVQTYEICGNKSTAKERKVTYDVKTGSEKYFSVKWSDKIDGKLSRIYVLNFKIVDGKILSMDEVLSPLSRSLMPELVKLSRNNLAADTTWQQFLEKIEQRHIQFYVVNSEWYIVFNPNPGSNKHIVDIKLPTYLLKG